MTTQVKVITVGASLTDIVPSTYPVGNATFGPGCRILQAFGCEDDGFHSLPPIKTPDGKGSIQFIRTNASEEYERLRPLAYQLADVFLFGYAPNLEGDDAAAATAALVEVCRLGKPVVALCIGASQKQPPKGQEATAFHELVQEAISTDAHAFECDFKWDFEHTSSASSVRDFCDEDARCAEVMRSTWEEVLGMCVLAHAHHQAEVGTGRRRRKCTIS
jgi:hypothetical protein